ncbi:MAG: LapA family protein [Chthoniobacteraceae bacterium]
MKKLKLIAALLLLVMVLVFTFQNTSVIRLRFLGWNLELSQALMIFGTFVAGLLMGWASIGLFRRRSGAGKP